MRKFVNWAENYFEKHGVYPDDFKLTEKLKNYALEKGIFNNEVGEIFEHFKNHHGGKGTLMADWDKVWYTWVRNEIKFNFSKYQPKQPKKIYEPE